jgi:hypothetical protein
VYTLDEELRRVEGLIVVNPFPKELVEQYHEYMQSKLHGRTA